MEQSNGMLDSEISVSSVDIIDSVEYTGSRLAFCHHLSIEITPCSKKRTFINISKSYIGAGVLAIAYSIKEGGIIVGIF